MHLPLGNSQKKKLFNWHSEDFSANSFSYHTSLNSGTNGEFIRDTFRWPILASYGIGLQNSPSVYHRKNMKIKNPGSHTPTQFFFTQTAFWDKKNETSCLQSGCISPKKCGIQPLLTVFSPDWFHNPIEFNPMRIQFNQYHLMPFRRNLMKKWTARSIRI